MKRIKIANALNALAPVEDLLVKGWVRTKRDAKGFSFLELNDGSCLKNIQAIVDHTPETLALLETIGTGASVSVEGSLSPSPGQGQKWEIKVRTLTLIGGADQATYPLQKKRHSDEFLRTIAHLRPRTNKYGAMFRIRSELALAIHDFFQERGFFYIQSPILTGADCEGAGEMFRVTTQDRCKPGTPEDDFFGKDAFLTVSGQLSAEMLALGLGDVYTFGPTFRAENSNTPRHVAEFWMVEPEMAFADLVEDMDLGEALIKSVTARILDRRAEDVELFAKFVDPGLMAALEVLVDRPFARVSYREAIRILQESPRTFEFPTEFGCDLQTEHERYLAEEHFKRPVIVHDYPKEVKAFYMRLNEDNETVAAMDVLVPRIGEIIGGSQREERLDVLESRIAELKLNREAYWWYLDTRRFGTVPHAGFGLGFERVLMMLTGVTNIRDAIPFPRAPKSLDF